MIIPLFLLLFRALLYLLPPTASAGWPVFCVWTCFAVICHNPEVCRQLPKDIRYSKCILFFYMAKRWCSFVVKNCGDFFGIVGFYGNILNVLNRRFTRISADSFFHHRLHGLIFDARSVEFITITYCSMASK